MDFVAVVDQVIAPLQQRGRVTYRTLQRQFQLDEAALEDVKEELIYGQRLAADEDGKVLVWTGASVTAPAAVSPLAAPSQPAPLAYTPLYLAEKILTSRSSATRASRPSPLPSAPLRSPRPMGMSSCRRSRTSASAPPTSPNNR